MENHPPNFDPLLTAPNQIKTPDTQRFSSKSCFAPFRSRLRGFFVVAAVLILCFGRTLIDLVVYALHSDLYSYILLIPFVSAYLIWPKRAQVALEPRSKWALALLPALAGGSALMGFRIAVRSGWSAIEADYLSLMTLSLLLFLLSAGLFFFGTKGLGAIAFPVAILIFCVPFPEAVRHGVETFFQLGSAETAYMMLRLSGMPVYRTGTQFQLPGFSIEVAPECSGIHSSIVLVITSFLAAYLFLNTKPNRLAFVLAVVPLALLRNGFRIFTVAQLCVHLGPQMIDSPIHRRGGPVFFLLSLVPLYVLLIYLKKRESRK